MKVARMGCNSIHSPKFFTDKTAGNDDYLILYIKTASVFVLNGITIEAKPNQIIVFDIGFPYKYGADKSYYINDWLHFEGVTTDFFRSIRLPLNTLIPVQDTDFITDIFKKILYEFNSSGSRSKQTLSLLLQAMLLKISEFHDNLTRNYTPSPYYQRLVQLRNDIYANPAADWNIKDMAAALNICPTYLQKLYKEQFNTTCIDEVIESRLQLSLQLLPQNNLTISQISKMCGYNSDVHFMRQFKKRFGITPTGYRQSNSA